MRVYLKGHNYEYETYHIIRLFLKREEINFVKKYEPENTNTFIISEYKDTGGEIIVLTTIRTLKKTVNEVFKQQYDKNLSHESSEYIKLAKGTVKMSLYKGLRQVSNVKVPWGILTGIRPTKIVHELIKEGKSDEDIKEILKQKYAASSEKIDLVIKVAYNELKILNSSKPNSISVYIGIPFCPTRCIYCSFISSSIEKTKKFVKPYIDSLIKEIKYTKKIVEDMNWNVENIYIGGGTPTTLPPVLLDRLLNTICTEFKMENVKEFTIEAGRPDTIDKEKLRIIKKYGADRISINPQTMNEKTLKIIGRYHTPQQIIDAFKVARDEGFNNINMDIIAGLPDETLDMFKYTMKQIGKLSPESITVHTLTIKRASELMERINQYEETRADTVYDMLEFSHKFTQENNMIPYYMYRQKNILGNMENVGYSKPGFECLYNVQIMEEQQSIIAMGCGGATKMVDLKNSRIDRIFNVKDVEQYINRIDEMIIRKNKIYEYFK